MNATAMNIHEINDAKAKPAYLRRVAADFDAMGSDATARDYRDAADTIERLLNVLGIPAFDA